MRWLIVLGLLLAAGRVEARVVMMPTIPRMCPGGPSWDKTATCIKRFGKLSVARSKADVRLVRLDSTDEHEFSSTAGIYLYVLRGKTWQLAGMMLGSEFSIVGFQRVSFGGKHAYRFDVANAGAENVNTDGVTLRPAWVKQRLSWFCGGRSIHCEPIVTSCDVYVQGRVLWTFRGKLTHERDGVMRVDGDRSLSGDRCQQESTVLISLLD